MTEITQEIRDSDDLRHNHLFNSTLDSLIEQAQQSLEFNASEDHHGFVKAQSALATLRILRAELMAPSEIIED